MDMTAFLQGHQPPPQDNVTPFDHSPKVECRALVVVRRGPKTVYTEAIGEQICDLVAGGNTIRQIGVMPGLPSRTTIRRWIAEDEDFRRAYALAKEGLVEDILEHILEIADDSADDVSLEEDAEGLPVVRANREAVARSALRIETRFRILAKMSPSKYGDAVLDIAPAPEPKRDGTGATIITSQLPVADWHEYLGGGRIADAILDRIIHNAHRIELASRDSLRINRPDLPHAGQSDI